MELKGTVAAVTGAAGGIGAAIASGLIAAGADVAAIDLKPVDCEALRAHAIAAGQQVRAWQCDVTDSEQVRRACAAVTAELGPATILVNNVGGSGAVPIEQIEDMNDDTWDHILSLNLGSIMRFCRGLVPGMKARGYGRIVNVSSTLKDGMFGPLGTLGARLPYVTAKSAIVGMTKQLAKDLGPFGITVNAIAPGLTLPGETARITQRFRALSPEAQQRFTAPIPAGRLGMGEDMANAVRFLVSPYSGYVSGEVLAVAGGA